MSKSTPADKLEALRGYYLIRKAPSTKRGWRLVHERYEGNKKRQKTVPMEAWSGLGFTEKMSIAEARVRAKQLNHKKNMDKEKLRRAAQRVADEKVIESHVIPPEYAEEFVELLKENHFGSAAHERKLLSHWQFVQKIVAELEIEGGDLYEERKKIYKFFIRHNLSPGYVNKILRILNMWGSFICRKQGQFFESIPSPRGQVREKIQESYAESDYYRADGAFPLTLKVLSKLKNGINHLPGQYEWMHVSLWFGLRPGEMENLFDPAKHRIEYDRSLKVNVLWVYQSKLSSVAKSKRWKPIPVVFDGQKEGLSYIKKGILKRPLNKTLKAATGIDNIGGYSGRKGFTDLMLGKGQSFEDISIWLGHASIDMTWKHYKDRKKVSFTPSKAG